MTRVKRFTVSERAVHWLTALAFFILLISGLVVGRSGTFHDVMYASHLAAAGVLVCGVALIVARGNRRALRTSARELRSLQAEDGEWLRAVPARVFAGAPEPPAARFNAGQKVNFMGVCIMLAALYVSGVDTIIAGTKHNLVFGGHKLATIALSVLVAGHLYMALVNRATRPGLSGMLGGSVDREWAHRHYPTMGAVAAIVARWLPATPETRMLEMTGQPHCPPADANASTASDTVGMGAEARIGTIGIIGAGQLGQALARTARPQPRAAAVKTPAGRWSTRSGQARAPIEKMMSGDREEARDGVEDFRRAAGRREL